MEKIELKVSDKLTFVCDDKGCWSVDDQDMPFLNGRVPESDVIASLKHHAKTNPEAKQMLIQHFPMLGFHS